MVQGNPAQLAQRPFLEWLGLQAGREDEVGRLAALVTDSWPVFWNRMDYLKWMVETGQPKEAVQSLTGAWIEWCQSPYRMRI